MAFGNGRLAAYDATADRWEVLIEADPVRLEELPLCMVYDPVNGRLVGCGRAECSVRRRSTLETREWTVLLEERTGRPAVVAPSVGPAFACPPGSTPDKPGPVAQARPPEGPMVFDRESGRIVLVGQPEDGGTETWAFDVCTNTWTRMRPDREPPPGTGQLVYDVDSDLTIASDGARMWAYDLEADTWTEKGPSLRSPARIPRLRLLRPGLGPRRRPGGRWRRRHAGPGAVELRRRDRHVDPDPPGAAARPSEPTTSSSPTTPPSTG